MDRTGTDPYVDYGYEESEMSMFYNDLVSSSFEQPMAAVSRGFNNKKSVAQSTEVQNVWEKDPLDTPVPGKAPTLCELSSSAFAEGSHWVEQDFDFSGYFPRNDVIIDNDVNLSSSAVDEVELEGVPEVEVDQPIDKLINSDESEVLLTGFSSDHQYCGSDVDWNILGEFLQLTNELGVGTGEPMGIQEAPVVQPIRIQDDPVVQPIRIQENPVAQPISIQEDPVVQPIRIQEDPVVQPIRIQEDPVMQPIRIQEDPVAQAQNMEEVVEIVEPTTSMATVTIDASGLGIDLGTILRSLEGCGISLASAQLSTAAPIHDDVIIDDYARPDQPSQAPSPEASSRAPSGLGDKEITDRRLLSYLKRRRQNNISCQKSRLARKAKFELMLQEKDSLESQNKHLKYKVSRLETLAEDMRNKLLAMVGSGNGGR